MLVAPQKQDMKSNKWEAAITRKYEKLKTDKEAEPNCY